MDHFGAVFPVNKTLVKRSVEGDSRHYGFVEMTHKEDIARAVERFNGTTFMGRIIRFDKLCS